MNALLLIRSHLGTVYALAAVFLAAVAVAALRLGAPVVAPAFEFALFGWLGVLLSRLAQARNTASEAEAPPRPAPATADKVDTLLRSIARLLQGHLSDAEAYSHRLNGANAKLSEHLQGGPLNEIVMALIADNRDMRDKLTGVRNQLEESRLQVLRLQHSLVRSEEAGMRDVVTAVGNRRFFELAFAEELERARKTGSDFCLALADLDRFKTINDRFGHLVGDRILRLFAEILVQNVRGSDRVARFGGEEFAIMLPGVNLNQAIEAADRIRTVLEAKQWTLEPSGERVGKVTVSLGVAQFRADDTGTDLLQRVDAHLYEAKTRGRNRVVSDHDGPSKTPRRTRALRAAAG